MLVGLYKIAPENTKAINTQRRTIHPGPLRPQRRSKPTGSVGKVDLQDPAHIAKMDRMRRRRGSGGGAAAAAGGESNVTADGIATVTNAPSRRSSRATPSARADKLIEEMTEE